MSDYKVYRLFPAPIFHFKVKNFRELNLELENYILDLKKKIKMDKKNQMLEAGIPRFLI